MKNTILLWVLFLSVISNAQVTKVNFQASGLTCSMCSNAIYKALKTLDFIESIETNMKQYTFELIFRQNTTVDFDAIRKKVEGAGFFVSRFTATIRFSNMHIKPNEPLLLGNQQLYFVDNKEQELNGERQVQFLDKGFVSSKEWRNKSLPLSSSISGIYHVSL